MPIATNDLQTRIDLRSDTVTLPTSKMLQAMMDASVGDDVFGEDPTVNALENRMAALFEMEAALWCGSGTLSNQVAICAQTRPGDEVICEREAHVFYYEGGGIAFNAGCQGRPLAGDRGRLEATEIEQAINPDDVHKARTALICLENTSNRGGGSCYSLEALDKIRDVADRHQLRLHLDGARLFNALVATGQTPKDFGKIFTSISVCFNKGLGCPAGSVLLGSREFIRMARRKRKVLGGGLRQAGYFAAAALYALDHHIDRLEMDHRRAKLIGTWMEAYPWVRRVLPVETNLVITELQGIPSSAFVAEMKRAQVLVLPFSATSVRWVTHLDISEEMMDLLHIRLNAYRPAV